MRAIIFCHETSHQFGRLGVEGPLALFPLVDRPFIQHIVEFLVQQNIRQLDLVLSHQPQAIERFLGDGTRWGAQIRFHLVKPAQPPYTVLKRLKVHPTEPILLGNGKSLPEVTFLKGGMPPHPHLPISYCYKSGAGKLLPEDWTGWAWVEGQNLKELGRRPEEAVSKLLELAARQGRCIDVPQCLSVESPQALMRSHATALNEEFPGLMQSGRKVRNGLWISRNVKVHPEATLTPPLFIGENCRIGSEARLGPFTSIGHNCIIDSGTRVENSIVLPETYVGQALELDNVIVGRNKLFNLSLGSSLQIADNFILGKVAGFRPGQWITRILTQLLAFGLLVLGSPLMAVTALVLKFSHSGSVFQSHEVVVRGAGVDTRNWDAFQLLSFACPREKSSEAFPPTALSDFFLRFLPALIRVVRGDLALVGVKPRSRQSLQGLPVDRRELYLKSRPGAISEALAIFGPCATADEEYAADAIYSVRSGLGYDLKLLGRYFFSLLTSSGSTGWRHPLKSCSQRPLG